MLNGASTATALLPRRNLVNLRRSMKDNVVFTAARRTNFVG
jgi:hypothetical protein